jgi:hypothetical protein
MVAILDFWIKGCLFKRMTYPKTVFIHGARSFGSNFFQDGGSGHFGYSPLAKNARVIFIKVIQSIVKIS